MTDLLKFLNLPVVKTHKPSTATHDTVKSDTVLSENPSSVPEITSAITTHSRLELEEKTINFSTRWFFQVVHRLRSPSKKWNFIDLYN